ncbi:ABC transporter substrate-binding protein [Methanospirillum stamsii]|uniref:ABC transporter substrate-binding protein n=1 Tax=Methanospirillum stamsii TaxID=1277351 RepID=A0A2V2MUV5_9EURY|nr:ABC transporter substrate-binding protein [Methanospirillum stamsii]PWR71159.1 ABC transporter substrate-binding protein [Methanospirillum stamsii]
MNMKSYSTILLLFLFIGLITFTQVAGDATTRTLTDMGGNEITIPTDIERIVVACQGGVAQEIVIMGSPKTVVTMSSMNMFPMFVKMYPNFKDLPNAGSFDDLNMETILKLKPDVVINSVTASKGNAKITENDIPVFQAYTGKASADTIYNEFRAFGELFNNQVKAEELISYWDEKKNFINDRMKSIPEDERKTVFYTSNKDLGTDTNWGVSYVATSGGINVAKNLGDAKVNPEKLAEWDPDVIIIRGNTDGTYPDQEIISNPQLSGLSAIKNGEIYNVPMGGFWWDRPSPESALGFLWLAKILYPDTFKDVDMVGEMKSFFKNFYRYSLSDEEANEILSVNN